MLSIDHNMLDYFKNMVFILDKINNNFPEYFTKSTYISSDYSELEYTCHFNIFNYVTNMLCESSEEFNILYRPAKHIKVKTFSVLSIQIINSYEFILSSHLNLKYDKYNRQGVRCCIKFNIEDNYIDLFKLKEYFKMIFFTDEEFLVKDIIK